jgi:hypothetical protein
MDFVVKEVTNEDRVFQEGVLNSGNYDKCEQDIDWKTLTKENENLPKNSKSIFDRIVGIPKKKWDDEELKKLASINKTYQCKYEKRNKIKEKFPDRSYKSCISKLSRLNI